MESKCLWFSKFLKRLVLARIYDCFALSLQCRMYTVPCTYRAYIIHGMNSACLSLQKTGCLQPRRIAIWVLFDRTEFLHDFGHRQSLLHFHFATTTKKKKVLKDNVWSPRWNVQSACVTINTNDGRFTIVQQQTLPICCIPPECLFAMSFKPNLFIEIQQATSYSIGQWMSLLISLH